ncbi:MAG: hypothetical protein K2Q18_02740, partial [Bdellovibrionales bacterium]|nr:hypothetical protein [Bdellovibrionales bacterium]
MKNVMCLLAIAIMTASCVNLNGSLEVNETLAAKRKGGFLNLQLKTVNIEPGVYSSELKFISKSSFNLTLKSKKEGEKDIVLPIKSLEENFDIPANGPVSIKGASVSQPFNIDGQIATTYNTSDVTKTNESCTFTR